MCYIIIQPFMLHVRARQLINEQLNFPTENSEKNTQNKTDSRLTMQNIGWKLICVVFGSKILSSTI